MRIVVWTNVVKDEIVARLRAVAGVEVGIVDNAQQLRASAAEMDALVLPTRFYDAAVAAALKAEAHRLRWIQLVSAGYEGPQQHGVPPGVVVTSAGDAWAITVAEHSMLLLLALIKCLPPILLNQAHHGWDRSFTTRMKSLHGRSMAVIGFGNIGQEIARRARAFGMSVIGVSRSGKPHPLADEVLPGSALHDALRRADAIVLAVPFLPETRHLVGAAEFALCKPDTILVNIARGAVIDTEALMEALRQGKIAGAGLDVTEPEPLPPEHPLWDCPNLIISPHLAGALDAGGRARIAAMIGGNVERFLAKEPLANVVTI